jgi:thiamine kinase-like enzyme
MTGDVGTGDAGTGDAGTGDAAARRAASLPLWHGIVEPMPIGGGITNRNFLVQDRGRAYFVRIGADIPIHGILRFNEQAASRAAAAAGISPPVIHAEPGALVLAYIEGRTLAPADIAEPAMLARIAPLLRRAHHEAQRHLRGPVLAFWVFHILRDYAHTLRGSGSSRARDLGPLLAAADRLERAVGPIDLVLGHNDLLAANLIDDGERLWLVDWDYAGFNSPLFDLGGLASNNDLDPTAEDLLLTLYFGHPPSADLRRRYGAMKCASLLREALWSMVSELHSSLDFDYPAYTETNLHRFETALAAFERM